MGLKKTIDIFKSLFGGIGGVFTTVTHAAAFKEYYDLFKGGLFPSADLLKEKGWKGILGLGDELPVEKRLMQMELKRANAVRGHIVYHFTPPKGSTAYTTMVYFVFRNKFRSYVLGLPTTMPQTKVLKTKVTRTSADGKTTTTETETASEEPGVDKPLEWLEKLADQILEGGDAMRISNYKKIRKLHLATDVPYPPTDKEGMIAATREILKELTSPATKFHNRVIRDAQWIEQEKRKMPWWSPMTWLYRFIRL